MELSLTLSNNNSLITGLNSQKKNICVHHGLSFHFAFTGYENYAFRKRQISVYPDTYLVLGEGTSYSVELDCMCAVRSLAVRFDHQFVNEFQYSWLKEPNYLLDNPFEVKKNALPVDETIFSFSGDIRYNIRHLEQIIRQDPNDEWLINEHLYHLLLNFYTQYQNELYKTCSGLNSIKKGTREELLRRLNLAKEYIYSNYNKAVSLEQVATYSCLSVTHLNRTFKQAFALTPHQFLMQVRLNRSRYLLEHTGDPVNEIVNTIGFESASTFIKLFRERFKITPLKFRTLLMN